MSPDKLVDTFPAPDDDVKTLYENLERSASKHPDVRQGLKWGREGQGQGGGAAPASTRT